MPDEQQSSYEQFKKQWGIGGTLAPGPTPVPEAKPPATTAAPSSSYDDFKKQWGIGVAPTPPNPAAAPQVAPTAAPAMPAVAPAPQPEAAPRQPGPVPFAPAPAAAPQPEIVPGGFGGEEKKPAVTPTPTPTQQEEPLAIRAFKEMGRFAATANAPVLNVVHGFARGLEKTLDIPRRLVQGDWEGETPHVLTAATGEAKEVFAPEDLQNQAHPVTKFLGNLLGGLESYMIPGAVAGEAGMALPMATTLQKFGSNLITFAGTDVFQTVGAGGNEEQARKALIKSIPTAALFTVAQAIPFDKISKNPWLTKALESTATGTAFAGSHALEGETDPTALAVSFLTGFGLHALTSGMPQRGLSPDARQKAMDAIFKDYTIDWKETNKIKEAQWVEVQNILDRAGVGVPGEAEPAKTPQPVASTPEEQHKAIFGGALGDTIEGQENRADAVRALVPQLGGQDRAERFYDLYKQDDAAKALEEFPEMASWATEQQKAAAITPAEREAAAGAVKEPPTPEPIPQPMGPAGSTPAPGAAEETPGLPPFPGTAASEPTKPAFGPFAPVTTIKRGAMVAPKVTEIVQPMGKGVETGRTAEPPAEPEKPPAPTPAPAKEAWEMTQAEWQDFEGIEEPSEYLYHGSPEQNLENIRKYGLQSKTRERNDYEEGDRTPREQELLYFEKQENQNWGGRKSVQLRINPDMLPKGIDIEEDGLRPGEFYTYHRNNDNYEIPPEAIDIFNKKTKQWEPLVPNEHRQTIEQALTSGLPVPKEVLADYPDLKPAEPAPPGAEGEAVSEAPAPKEPQGKGVGEPTKLDELITGKKGLYAGGIYTWKQALDHAVKTFNRPIQPIYEKTDKLLEEPKISGYELVISNKGRKLRLGIPKELNEYVERLTEPPTAQPPLPGEGEPPKYRLADLSFEERLSGLQESPLWQDLAPHEQEALLRGGEEGDLHPALKDFMQQMAAPGMTRGMKEHAALYPPGWEIAKFRAAVNEALAGPLVRGLTTEQMQTRLGKNGTVRELTKNLGPDDNRRWEIKTNTGHQILVREDKAGTLGVALELSRDYKALGFGPAGKVAGQWTEMRGIGSFIELARVDGIRTLDHELWHDIERYFLTPKELEKVTAKFGDNEEVRAEAYANWDPKAAPDTIFQKVLDFFQRIVKAVTGYQNVDDIFAKARSGEMFGREAGERKAPGAMVQPKYRVIDEAATRLKEEKEAAKGWYDRVSVSLGKWLNAPRLSEEALKTDMSIRKSAAEADLQIKRMTTEFTTYIDKMGPIAGDLTQEFLRNYENRSVPGGQNAEHGWLNENAEPASKSIFKAFGDYFRKEERRYMETARALGRAPNEIPNYIDHLWEENEAIKQVKQQILAATSSGRSMQGPSYFKLLRTITDIPSGIAAGYVPKYPTLPEMVIAGRAAHEHALAADKRIFDLKQNGYEKIVKNKGEAPEGWSQLPGGYGEVWAKVQRRAGQMIPEQADEETLPLGGGEGRMGYEDVSKVNAWTRVGYRYAPNYVVTQFENFLGRGLKGGDIYSVYQGSINSIRTFQMALSWFHATFESLNAMATQAGRGMTEALGGLFTGDISRLGRGLGEVAGSPLAPVKDIRLGLKASRLLMNPESAKDDLQAQQVLAIGKALVSGGQRIKVETKLSHIMDTYFREAWDEAKGLHGIRASNKVMRALSAPIMDYIVPFAKLGSAMRSYMGEVERWERANPGETMSNEQALRIAYETSEHSDNVFGQIAMDNVGMNATVKSLLSGVIQFPTWNIGTVKVGTRAVGGTSDLLLKARDLIAGKPVRQLEMKDRLALQYTAGLLFTVGLVGGLMHYAFTGKRPEELADFYFPQTGEMNPNGSPERVQLPSYLKDAMGITHHPGQTISAKLAAPLHIITDLYQNRDYWGTQVYDPDSWWGSKGLDILKYVGKSATPFVLQSYRHGAQETPSRAMASLLGVRPVPREIANSSAQNIIDEYNQIMRASVTTKESKETKDLKGELMNLARASDEAGFQEKAQEAITGNKLTRAQVKEIIGESQVPPGQTRFYRLPLNWMTKAMTQASDYEREQWIPLMLKKIAGAKLEILMRDREDLIPLLEELDLQPLADKIRDLELPEEATEFNLTGLGLVQPRPEMAGMDEVQTAISESLTQHTAALGQETKPKAGTRLPGLAPRKESEKTRNRGLLGI